MKKKTFLSVVLALILSVSMLTPIMSIAAIKGDVDNDGKVMAADARFALRYSVNLERFSDTQKNAADMNNDGNITAADARKILRLSVGLVDPANITIENYDKNKDYSQYKVISCADPFYYIVLRTDIRVTDVKFYGLEDEPDVYEYTFTEVSSCDEIVPEQPVVVQLPHKNSYVTHGISYKDADGQEKVCAFVYDEATGGDALKLLKPIPKKAKLAAKTGQYGVNYVNSEKVYADIASSCIPVVVTTDSRISDFKVYSLQSGYYGNYTATLIEDCGVVEADKSVVIYAKLGNSANCRYGFSYTDTDGTTKIYGIGDFDFNGSINLYNVSVYVEKIPDRATITGEFAKRVYYDYSVFDTVNADNSQYRWGAIIKTDATIKNVKVHYGTLDFINGNAVFCVDRSYNYGTLNPDTPLLIYIAQPGDFPSYALSYTDVDGTTRAFIFDESYHPSGEPNPSPVPTRGGEIDYCRIKF